MGIVGKLSTTERSGPGWRAQIMLVPGAASRAVLTLQRLETCGQLIPGKSVIDFDPSKIGAKTTKDKEAPAPEPEVDAEPVDE